MKNAIETIIELIRNKVCMMNVLLEERGNLDITTTFERLRHELTGMMICLKNVNEDDKFYCTNFYYDRIEFGYYDEDHKWNLIERGSRK